MTFCFISRFMCVQNEHFKLKSEIGCQISTPETDLMRGIIKTRLDLINKTINWASICKFDQPNIHLFLLFFLSSDKGREPDEPEATLLIPNIIFTHWKRCAVLRSLPVATRSQRIPDAGTSCPTSSSWAFHRDGIRQACAGMAGNTS